MTHVLIAVDDTETSVRAATTAHRLFGDGARYTVINVAPGASLMWGDSSLPSGGVYPLVPTAGSSAGLATMPLGLATAPPPDQVASGRIEEAARRAERVASEAGIVDAEPVGETGDAGEAILAAARDFHADVIVLGTHERTWFSRLVSGSVTKDVIRHADVPVVVAR